MTTNIIKLGEKLFKPRLSQIHSHNEWQELDLPIEAVNWERYICGVVQVDRILNCLYVYHILNQNNATREWHSYDVDFHPKTQIAIADIKHGRSPNTDYEYYIQVFMAAYLEPEFAKCINLNCDDYNYADEVFSVIHSKKQLGEIYRHFLQYNYQKFKYRKGLMNYLGGYIKRDFIGKWTPQLFLGVYDSKEERDYELFNAEMTQLKDIRDPLTLIYLDLIDARFAGSCMYNAADDERPIKNDRSKFMANIIESLEINWAFIKNCLKEQTAKSADYPIQLIRASCYVYQGKYYYVPGFILQILDREILTMQDKSGKTPLHYLYELKDTSISDAGQIIYHFVGFYGPRSDIKQHNLDNFKVKQRAKQLVFKKLLDALFTTENTTEFYSKILDWRTHSLVPDHSRYDDPLYYKCAVFLGKSLLRNITKPESNKLIDFFDRYCNHRAKLPHEIDKTTYYTAMYTVADDLNDSRDCVPDYIHVIAY